MRELFRKLQILAMLAVAACGYDPADANPFYPASSNNGVVLSANGWILDTSQCDQFDRTFCYSEEFENGAANCTTVQSLVGAASGAGAGCSYNATSVASSGHPGVLSMATGTTGTGGVRVFTMPGGAVFGGSTGQFCTAQLVQFPILSTSVIEYVARYGFNEPTSNANSVDAVQITYDRAAATTDHFTFETRQNSTSTTTVLNGTGAATCTAAVSAGTWYTIMQCVNAAGTSATAYVNGQLCATHTTNIPTTVTRATGIGAQCFNNSGSVPASELCNIDYIRAVLPFPALR